jgi:transcriptional regulator with XRE-family HTH domain
MKVKKLTKRLKKRGSKIKSLMVLKGVRQVDIAEEEKVSAPLVSAVVSGHKKSPRVRNAIARALGTAVEDLWPNNNGEKAA